MKQSISKLLVLSMVTTCSLGVLTAQATDGGAPAAPSGQVARAATEFDKIVLKNMPEETGTSIKGRTYHVYHIFDGVQGSATSPIEAGTNFDVMFADGTTYPNVDPAGDNWTISGGDSTRLRQALDFVSSYSTGLVKDPATLARLFADKVAGTTPYITTDPSNIVVSDAGGGESLEIPVGYGYYLILDVTDMTSGDFDGAKSSAMIVNVDGSKENYDVNVKATAPTVDKEIWHNDKDGTGGWDTVGDYQIGDIVDFQITSTLPGENVQYYETYTYILRDVMSEGITYNGDVKVYGVKDGVKSADPLVTYTPDTSPGTTEDETTAGGTLAFEIGVDVKALWEAGHNYDSLLTEYTGTVNDSSVVVAEQNLITLFFSNDPNGDGYGTVTDTVYSYGFSLEVNKENEYGEALEGVTFSLFYAEDLKNGEGSLAELSDEALKALAIPVVVDTAPEEKLDGNLAVIEGYDYYRVALDGEAGATTEIVTNGTGNFVINGLDDQVTYALKEMATVDGYTLLNGIIEFTITASYKDDFTVEIVSVTSNDGTNSDVSVGVNPDLSVGAGVINRNTRTLPETGGVGTTIFRIVGGMTMAGAAGAVVIKSKKAKSN